ncbi:hypothetical protein [Chondrinema litorale]|uniref:hypothetical protein n=1 Tax=Chondrinema litorale TaxID=2994555 RepID=UPI0025434F7B|nr:hypothetical protein [Chondrinema litorale]UZR96322.1 hypothetical protein OQ292_21935 [Chondrinema litorale]
MNIKPLILTLIIFACSSNNKQNTLVKEEPELKTEQSSELGINNDLKSTNTEPNDWEAHQDSLRIELVKSKSNNFLIGSFLEELYIRNLVSVSSAYNY